jgi:SMODS-associating 2TM, beta-strand rich effector domain
VCIRPVGRPPIRIYRQSRPLPATFLPILLAHTVNMLHLLPIRLLLTGSVALFGVAVLAAGYAGLIGTGDTLSDVTRIIRWSSTAALMLMFVPYAAWRWVPRFQRLTFPYLGGEWVGELKFSGSNGTGVRKVTLNIRHSLLRVVLILDSVESTSRTLAVHAERDVGINRDRLYYIYLNERKEGVVGAGERYRGLAVLRVEMDDKARLYGDYFTEKNGNGTISLTLRQPNQWWAIWK